MRKRIISATDEEMCDIVMDYLHNLSNRKKRKIQSAILPDIFKAKNIFYDNEIIERISLKLEEKSYIERDPQNDTRYLYPYCKEKPQKNSHDTIRNSIGVTFYFKLTRRGKNFKANGQSLSKEQTGGKEEWFKIFKNIFWILKQLTHLICDFKMPDINLYLFINAIMGIDVLNLLNPTFDFISRIRRWIAVPFNN